MVAFGGVARREGAESGALPLPTLHGLEPVTSSLAGLDSYPLSLSSPPPSLLPPSPPLALPGGLGFEPFFV